jgi:hypothetical protein
MFIAWAFLEDWRVECDKFTLKMATAMFAETLNNFQHSTRPIPESRYCTTTIPFGMKGKGMGKGNTLIFVCSEEQSETNI